MAEFRIIRSPENSRNKRKENIMTTSEKNSPARQERSVKPPLHHRTVLIVSLQEDLIKTISRELFKASYYCLKEYTSEQAITTLDALKVSVVLIDIDIPIEETNRMIEWVEENHPEVQVFLVNSTRLCYELHRSPARSDNPISFSAQRLQEALKPQLDPACKQEVA